MRVFYDHQVFSNQEFGGISRYFFELISYASAKGIDHHLSLLTSNNVFAKQINQNIPSFFKGITFRGKRRLLEYINRINAVRDLKSRQYDLFHPTFYNDYFLNGGIQGKPLVVTCHDMINEKFKDLSVNNPTAAWKRKQIEAATAVIAVSENTKRDIIEILNYPQEKIFVTPLASSLNIEAFIPESPEVKELGDYILYVGLRPLYKNFISYVESIEPILRGTSIKLICAGGGAFSEEEQKFLKKHNLLHQVIQKPINDSFLAQLYQNAIAFVFPSKYEGFGIPTLEAFSTGCPVLLANTGSLPEVGGDAAFYFDPFDQNSMYQATNRLVHDEELRSSFRQKGLSRAKEFSWENTAKLTFDIYNTVLQRG